MRGGIPPAQITSYKTQLALAAGQSPASERGKIVGFSERRSSCSVERIFSKEKLMHISSTSPDVSEFDPEPICYSGNSCQKMKMSIFLVLTSLSTKFVSMRCMKEVKGCRSDVLSFI